MLDSRKLMIDLQGINDCTDIDYSAIIDAIEVVKMWESFIQRYGSYSICLGLDDMRKVRDLTDSIEREFFPTIIKAKVIAHIESGYDYSALDILKAIQEVQGVKGAAISNVKEK